MATKNSSGKFVIEFDTKSLILFGILAMASMGLIFYIGMSYGKALRNTDPGQVVIRSLEKPADEANNARSSLFDPTGSGKTAETYEKTLKEILNDPAKPAPTPADIASQIKTETASVSQPEKQQDAPPKSADTPAEKPAEKSGLVGTDRYYTVQILATNKYDKANGLIKALKTKKYEAYIQNIPTEGGGTLYRVRVGREPKEKAEAMKIALEKELKGLADLSIVEVE